MFHKFQRWDIYARHNKNDIFKNVENDLVTIGEILVDMISAEFMDKRNVILIFETLEGLLLI
ncbi:hypothetical protein PL321_04150 [Caloramator sp. mosi_1]|uniref:hypothetical protein n=1 Tax=Caloramator sp. mosi_1 TaxID=3023090 RepID=UPI00235FB35B|nr:hypothetical protein [Caloramator sp. mosi_1]WDC84818.1 hypothetical protein PL321_04150 [Caloramator sp. mosi_1]